jgi:hypothetical protein
MIKFGAVDKTHLVVLRTKSEGVDRFGDFMSWKKFRRVDGWSATTKFTPGDLVFFYFTKPNESIGAVGLVESEPIKEEGDFDWREKKTTFSCDYRPVWFLENGWPISKAKKTKKLNDWLATKPYRCTRQIPKEIGLMILNQIVHQNPKLRSALTKEGVIHG